MLNIVLYQPEIPPNTGNIIRLCANTGARLHLVGPLGFQLDNTRVKRAGLDYAEMAHVQQYVSWNTFKEENPDMKLWAFSTRGKSLTTRPALRRVMVCCLGRKPADCPNPYWLKRALKTACTCPWQMLHAALIYPTR